MEKEIVSLLMNYINTKGLKIGDQLPSTVALAKEFNETPSKIRTALISLASIGLIEIRPRSGSFIRALDINIIERLFNIILNQGISDESPSLLNVYEFKTMVDAEIFPAAAKTRTDIELYQLNSIIKEQHDQIDNLDNFISCDEKFHRLIARITRNPLYVLMIDILQAMLRPDRVKNENYTIETRKKVLVDHEQLFQAIKKNDVKAAAELSRKHSDRRKIELIESV